MVGGIGFLLCGFDDEGSELKEKMDETSPCFAGEGEEVFHNLLQAKMIKIKRAAPCCAASAGLR